MPRANVGAARPDELARRRAARVTIVGLAVFAGLGWVADIPEAAGPGFFAVFTLGAQADFGGGPRRRAIRYLLTGMVSAAMLLLAAAIQDHPPLVVAATAVVVFTTLFLGTLGGPFYSARFPVVIAFLYGATTQASGNLLVERIGGWAAGTVAITVGALVLWPAPDLSEVPGLVADVLRRAAETLRGRVPDRARDRLLGTSHRLRIAASREHLHLGAVAADERRRAELVHAAERVAAYCAVATPVATSPDDVALTDAAAEALESCAGATPRPVASGTDPARFAPPLQSALDRHALRMAAAIDDPPPATAPSETLRAEVTATDVRIAARMALTVATLVDEQRGAGRTDPGSADDEVADRPETALRAQLDLRSLWFRDALRAAVAVSIAVALVLDGVGGDHGFWVALGAFTVLRADLATIGRSSWSTVLGTTIGFAVSSVVVLISEDVDAVLWIAFVVALIVAGHGDRLRPEIGAAAFTTLLVVMYTLVQPAGLETGELRLVNVALGVAITLGVTMILWPRPGRGPRRLVAGVVDDARHALLGAIDGTPGVDPHTVIGELDRVLDVVSTSAPRALADDTRARVLVTVDLTATMADFLQAPDTTASVPLAAVVDAPLLRDALRSDGARVDTALASLGARLVQGPGPTATPPPAALMHAVTTALSAEEPVDAAAMSAGIRLAAGFATVHRIAGEVRGPTARWASPGDASRRADQPTRTGTFE